ncbi:hypothetical protein QFZ75_001769 [Streptomyces sp. V3I8]|nr:hypothetical protein [Streptomyces sp. V3I8]
MGHRRDGGFSKVVTGAGQLPELTASNGELTVCKEAGLPSGGSKNWL